MSDIRNDAGRHRYALDVDGEEAFAAYEQEGDTIAFTHTVVPSPLQGQGIGTRLIDGALADVRRAGLKVVAECPFVAAYIERHPAERDLLA